MENSFRSHFTFNYKEILLDEIALEGLEGIGIEFLWKRIEKRISSPVTEKMKIRFWKFIVNFETVTFYEVPEPMPNIEILDRFKIIQEDSGQLIDPPDFIDGPYEYCPIENEYGSSIYYNRRILVKKKYIRNLSLESVLSKYGDRIAIVATLEERWRALASHVPMLYLSQLSQVHYCILELVGKARENGQMTVGKTNLTKVMKDPKHLFYHRKLLQDMGLIRTQFHSQIIQGRGMKSILLRIKRFHQPILLSSPKVGKIRVLIDYLKERPNHTELVDSLIKSGCLDHKHSKRLQKTINVFKFEEIQQNLNEASKNIKQKVIKKKYIALNISSDESNHSDDETSAAPLECQYTIGVSLLRQAYERFLEAGLKGLTQIELAQILGVEFYTTRTICRTLKSKNIVKEFLEDKGRQRTARYIAVAATAEMDNRYAEEKNKLMEYLNSTGVEESPDTDEVPMKKMKVEETNANEDTNNVDTEITELKAIAGLENVTNESLLNSKKNPTLRQLKFANGLIKVIREKRAVSGYQTLSTAVSKETGEPPMDTKALKLFVQKLVGDKQLKLFRIKWPGFHQKYTTLVCDPSMKISDTFIKAKYKEISMKALTSKKTKVKKALTENVLRPLSQFAYPRYMKIQKLHELIISVVYFNEVKNENFDLPEGFASVLTILPEMTIGFAVGNISNMAISDISNMKIDDNLLDIKLKSAPANLYEKLLQSKSLQNSIRLNLKALAMLGLIQLVTETVPTPSADYEGNLLSYVFYVNRSAKILDTTGTWPKQDADLKKLEKSYYFKTFEDVTNYWSDVYNISTSTNVDLVIKRGRKNIKPPVRKTEDVYLYDNGERYGDGLGPCAFDSTFFMDIPRLWRTFYIRSSKINQQPIRRKKRGKRIKLEVVKKPKVKCIIKKKVLRSVDDVAFNKRKKRKVPESLIKWSKWEDRIIMLCKAAITIMSPTCHPDSHKVRNTVAKDILYPHDEKKTATACHRRAATIEHMSTLMHEKECILNEIRRRQNILQKYENLLKKLRQKCSTNLNKLFKESRIPMLELIWTMCLISRTKSFTQPAPCVALEYDDFIENFNVTSASVSKMHNIYRTPVECEPILASLKEGIIMTTMLSFNNIVTAEVASKIYSVFKEHPEAMLRSALEHLRKSGAIAARDKILNSHLHKIQVEDIVQSSYKISAFYQRRWICRLNSEFIDNLAETLDIRIPTNGVKGSPEINCIFCEMHTCDIIDVISITTPVISGHSGSIMQEEQLNVIDIENKYSLKSGLAGCRNKIDISEFSDLYKDIDIEDLIKYLFSYYAVEQTKKVDIDQDEVITCLKEKCEKGCTFKELQELLNWDNKSLLERLSELESKEIIKRIGYYENRVILSDFLTTWTLKVDGKSVIPVPWLTLEWDLRFEVLFKWASVIVNKVFECPGCSIEFLSSNCEMLSHKAVQDICMFLRRCECVTLNCIRTSDPDLFSDNLPPQELSEFNIYDSPDNILVFPVNNILTRYAYIRKRILDRKNKK